MCTTRSISSRPCASRSFSRSRGARGPRLLLMLAFSLEFQPAGAGAFGQSLDAAVIPVPAAIENHLGHAGLLGPLRDQRADLAGGVARGALRRPLLQPGVQRRRMRERRALAVVDHLGVDVPAALVDREPRPLGLPPDSLANPDAHPPPGFRACLRSVHDYFPPALPTFRLMTSSAYLMPLAL